MTRPISLTSAAINPRQWLKSPHAVMVNQENGYIVRVFPEPDGPTFRVMVERPTGSFLRLSWYDPRLYGVGVRKLIEIHETTRDDPESLHQAKPTRLAA